MSKIIPPLEQPIDAIVFDCDGTLASIEGIDWLAEQNGVDNQVKILTEAAMGQIGLTPHLYQQRLDLVRPTKDQVQKLGAEYIAQLTAGAEELVKKLQAQNKHVYLVSAGLYPAIKILGNYLGVEDDHIFAIDIYFDRDGNYSGFDDQSPLASNQGKRDIVSQIKTQLPQIAYVGDGLNDIAVLGLVTRFIGFGGVFYRKKIEEVSDVYIKSASILDALPYLLAETERKN